MTAQIMTDTTTGETHTPTSHRLRKPVSKGDFWRGLLRGFGAIVLIAAIGLGVGSAVLPRILGAVPLTVLTGSMTPTIKPGDLVVVKPTDPSSLKIGDVVTFQPVSNDPALITHRIIGLTYANGKVSAVTTQGDANGAADDPIKVAQIKGKVIYTVPWVGQLSDHGNLKMIGWGIGGLLVLYGVVMLFKPSKPSKRKDVEDES